VFSNGSTTRPAGSSEIRQVDYSEGLKVAYRWYDSAGIAPLFPSGYGLSYTTFAVDQHADPADWGSVLLMCLELAAGGRLPRLTIDRSHNPEP
jgi:hypothetical protein